MSFALPAFAVSYWRSGTAECVPGQGVATRVYAVEDHYHYKGGQGIDWTIPRSATWGVTVLSATNPPLQTWKVGNRPPYAHDYGNSYGYCASL